MKIKEIIKKPFKMAIKLGEKPVKFGHATTGVSTGIIAYGLAKETLPEEHKHHASTIGLAVGASSILIYQKVDDVITSLIEEAKAEVEAEETLTTVIDETETSEETEVVKDSEYYRKLIIELAPTGEELKAFMQAMGAEHFKLDGNGGTKIENDEFCEFVINLRKEGENNEK